jgi:tetratricopeptide (TPR) repeat protein
MLRKTLLLLMMVAVVVTLSCAKGPVEDAVDPVEEAWTAVRAELGEAETAEEKTVLYEGYLAEFPDTERSAGLAGAIAYYRGHEMEDPQGAFQILDAALAQIEDPEQRFGVAMEALSLADSVDVPYSVAEVADELKAVRPLDYGENQWVATTAADLEEWVVADAHAHAALELATPEIYASDYPDREFTDEQLTARAGRRRAESLAYAGWAKYNLGNLDEAFARFAAADEVGSVSYTGVPNTPLYEFWGRAALAEGELDSAVELLGAQALFGEDGSSAMPYLRDAYVAKNGNEEGFDEFLWATRNELATEVDNFELLDYEGNPFRLSDVGEKVVLLAFWFPT